MKTRIGMLVVSVLGILTIGAIASRGQIMSQMEFKMSQPFTVANTTLPAGSYVIRPVSGTDQTMLEVAGMGTGKPTVIVETDAIQADAVKGASHVVFNKYKNVLALSQIFPGGGNQGYQLTQGHPEKQAAKSEQPTKQTVTAAAK